MVGYEDMHFRGPCLHKPPAHTGNCSDLNFRRLARQNSGCENSIFFRTQTHEKNSRRYLIRNFEQIALRKNHQQPIVLHEEITLPPGKKLYFASDFHLGVPDAASSRQREAKIIRWLESIEGSAHMVFVVGDIFDFWFEYKHVIPKGFVRLQGKLAELVDGGVPVVFFTGNHDMWMFDYFPSELGIPVFREPQQYLVNGKSLLVGHGDGLGPGDGTYKLLKKVFANPLSQWLFARLHPGVGVGIATAWSRRSRITNTAKGEEKFKGDGEWLWTYCKEMERQQHRDFYVFGHRHLPLELPVGATARYINLGEWVNHCTYAVFDGQNMGLHTFEN